jgi:hypothetical protein
MQKARNLVCNNHATLQRRNNHENNLVTQKARNLVCNNNATLQRNNHGNLATQQSHNLATQQSHNLATQQSRNTCNTEIRIVMLLLICYIWNNRIDSLLNY